MCMNSTVTYHTRWKKKKKQKQTKAQRGHANQMHTKTIVQPTIYITCEGNWTPQQPVRLSLWVREQASVERKMHSLFVNSHPCSILLFNLILLVLFYNTTAVIKLPPNETYPAIFVFGDSTVDTGNNNNRITPSKANYRPYGNDFKGKVATGRFSNGKVPSDMIGINSW